MLVHEVRGKEYMGFSVLGLVPMLQKEGEKRVAPPNNLTIIVKYPGLQVGIPDAVRASILSKSLLTIFPMNAPAHKPCQTQDPSGFPSQAFFTFALPLFRHCNKLSAWSNATEL